MQYRAESRQHHAIATLLRNDPSKIFVHDIIRKNDFAGVVAMFKQDVDPNCVRHHLESPSVSSIMNSDCEY